MERIRPLGTCLLVASSLWSSACAGPEATSAAEQVSQPEGEASPYREAVPRSGRFVVRWRPVPSPVPLNENFELDVLITSPGDDGGPVLGAEVYVQGDMPAHGHGMVRQPRAQEVGAGRYRVLGLLLHMAGHWELSIDIVHAGVAETADFDLDL